MNGVALLIASTLSWMQAGQTPPGPEQVVLEPGQVTLEVGASTIVDATVLDESGRELTGSSVFWLTPTPEVIAVDQSGRITGVGAGEGRVAARAGNRVGFARVVVRPAPPARLDAVVPVQQFPAGTSMPLRVRALTEDGEVLADASLQFDSSDPTVATVDEVGRVWAVEPGEATVTVSSGGTTTQVEIEVTPPVPMDLEIVPQSRTVRTGDVVRFRLEGGAELYPAWSQDGPEAQIEDEGGEGVFVAEEPGRYRVTALVGPGAAATTFVTVEQRLDEAELVRVGRGAAAEHHSGDTWVFEGADGRDYAYVGTFMYDWMKVWDVTDPSTPVLTDSLQLDARRINDVKIHESNRLGILTREGASDRRNGIVVLDLTEPSSPRIISEYKRTVPGGVHNVWIQGDLVYAVHNGTSDIHIIDISDPANPDEVGRWGIESQNKSLHDVIVQEGYAHLSYWDDGVVTLDVGAGTHGGTPTEPAFVSRYKYPVGNTHTAWRSGRYLFVGDEIFPDDWDADRPIEARGYIHVLDFQDPDNPVEVAKYEVPEAGAHNIWVEGDRLYVGYYQAGLRVVDISGELRGDLYAQGREIAILKTTDAESTVPNWGMTWGAQIHKGNIFTSDLNSGLWIVKLIEGDRLVS